jgi:ribosomal-protein-alanine N-acetyltransferase
MIMKTFTGERVIVRPMTEDDATPLYASWLQDEEVNRYLATKGSTTEELKAYIAQKNAQEDTEFYGIFLREDGRHIGTTKLEPIDKVAKAATIGIMIGDKREWGKGLAREAMQLIIQHCFNELGMDEVRLGVLGQNTSAIEAYKKLGFVEVARKPQSVHFPNGIFDQVEMTLKKHAS